MKERMLILAIIFCIVNIQSILASPLPIHERLCTEKIDFISEKFSFMDGIDSRQTSIYDEKYYFVEGICNRNPLEFFERPFQFYYKGNMTRIKVFIDNEKLLDTVLSVSYAKMFTDGLNYSEWPNVTVYECPGYVDCPISNMSKNLKDYDNSVIKVYADDTLVREYSMKYYPGPDESDQGPKVILRDYTLQTIIIFLIIIGCIAFFILYKKSKK